MKRKGNFCQRGERFGSARLASPSCFAKQASFRLFAVCFLGGFGGGNILLQFGVLFVFSLLFVLYF